MPDHDYSNRIMEDDDHPYDRNSMDSFSDEETRPPIRDHYPAFGSVADGKRIAGRPYTEPISYLRQRNSEGPSSSPSNTWSSGSSKSKRSLEEDVEMRTSGAPGMESNSIDRYPYCPRTVVRDRQLTPPPSHTPLRTSSVVANLEKKVAKSGQQILNRDDKIAFLTRYTDRMHTKLQALGIKDWGQKDIQTKKTYQLMIQHNNKTGEKDLVEFYLGRYGSAPSGDEPPELVSPTILPTTEV